MNESVEIPVEILDYSCASPFEEAVAAVEAFVRNTLAVAKTKLMEPSVTIHQPQHYFDIVKFPPSLLPSYMTNPDDTDRHSLQLHLRLDLFLYQQESCNHPVVQLFRVGSFLTILPEPRHNGRVSATEHATLLSVATAACTASGSGLACFTPASDPYQGLWRGYLRTVPSVLSVNAEPSEGTSSPLFTMQRTHFDGKNWVFFLPALADDSTVVKEVPLIHLDSVKKPFISSKRMKQHTQKQSVAVAVPVPACIVRFAMQTIDFSGAYHDVHGASRLSTLEGLLELFHANLGAHAKCVVEQGSLMIRASAVVSYSIVEVRIDEWESLVAASNGLRRDDDDVFPQQVLNKHLCRSVSVGSSSAPMSEFLLDCKWKGLHTDMIVDGVGRSDFSNPEDCHDASLRVVWDANPILSTIAVESLHALTGTILAYFDGISGSTMSLSSDTNNNGSLASKDELAIDTSDVTDEMLTQHLATIFDFDQRKMNNVGILDDIVDQHIRANQNHPLVDEFEVWLAKTKRHDLRFFSPPDSLLSRFAHECTFLKSVDEMMMLWKRIVGRLRSMCDVALDARTTHDAELALRRMRELLNVTFPEELHTLSGKRKVRAKPMQPDLDTCLMYQKIQALYLALEDAVAFTASAGEQAAIPTQAAKVADGWGDDDLDLGEADDDHSADEEEHQTGANPKQHAGDGWEDDDGLHSLPSTEDDENDEGNEKESAESLSRYTAKLVLSGASVKVPSLPRTAPVTSDTLEKTKDELVVLGTGAAAQQARLKLQSKVTEDQMLAFIELNGNETILADFVQWYSPKDFVSKETSDRSSPQAEWPFEPNEDQKARLGLAALGKRMHRHQQSSDDAPSSPSQEHNLWLSLWESSLARYQQQGTNAPSKKPSHILYNPHAEVAILLRWLESTASVLVGSTVVVSAFSSALHRASQLLIGDGTSSPEVYQTLVKNIRSATDGMPSSLTDSLAFVFSDTVVTSPLRMKEQRQQVHREASEALSLFREGEALMSLSVIENLLSVKLACSQWFSPEPLIVNPLLMLYTRVAAADEKSDLECPAYPSAKASFVTINKALWRGPSGVCRRILACSEKRTESTAAKSPVSKRYEICGKVCRAPQLSSVATEQRLVVVVNLVEKHLQIAQGLSGPMI